jgi:DNA-binding beta-propeller fold protein YncE
MRTVPVTAVTALAIAVTKTALILLHLLIASLLLPVSAAEADSLYIGDGDDNSVKRFDAATGAYLGTFVAPGSGGLLGPRGLIFTRGRLYVANQNVDQEFGGEILRYRRSDGQFVDALVPCNPNPPLDRACDPNAPFAPRGLIRGLLPTVYVADLGDFAAHPGAVKQYDAEIGHFISDLDSTGFSAAFFPRGLVFGPDRRIYVSVVGNLVTGDVLSGYVLRFNPLTGRFVDVFTSHLAGGCAADLHRPEGLVFGPDGKLYVTAFRADATDTDKILIFSGKGQCLDKIDLDQVGEPRAFAQALLFGPGGSLFVPINNAGQPSTNPFTGEVRRYDVTDSSFPHDIFVDPSAEGGPLRQPWYLTFGATDPRTLKYGH